MDFRGYAKGDFVYHCHILNHEDGGMMAIIRVAPKGPVERPQWQNGRRERRGTPSFSARRTVSEGLPANLEAVAQGDAAGVVVRRAGDLDDRAVGGVVAEPIVAEVGDQVEMAVEVTAERRLRRPCIADPNPDRRGR